MERVAVALGAASRGSIGSEARRARPVARWLCAGAALTVLTLAQFPAATQVLAATKPATTSPLAQDWPMYLHDTTRSGYSADSAITASNASTLMPRPGWPVNLGGKVISTQPVVVNGVIYSGSWDGNEYAVNTAGKVLWKTPLGVTTPADPNCGSSLGVVSTPAVANLAVMGDSQPSSVLFIGGGGNDAAGGGSAKMYAIDAKTGAVRWQTSVGPAPATVIYSSPVVYTPAGASVPSVYVGVSSYADCPLVQGKLLQFDARNGWLQHEFDVVPSGCLGGGIWGSPTIDASDGSVYVATGNGVPCNASGPTYMENVVKLRAWDLTVAASWQVPANQSSDDNDFGSAPTLFTGSVTSGAPQKSLVGIGCKNGLFYVFNRANLAAGPLAQLHIAVGGTAPENGQGTISPAAWDGNHLYIGGGQPFANNTQWMGVVYGWDPNNLSAPLWTDPMPGTVLGAVSAAPGYVFFGQGPTLSVVRASDGAGLRWLTSGSGIFFGAPSVSHGVLYEGDSNGNLYAYSLNGT